MTASEGYGHELGMHPVPTDYDYLTCTYCPKLLAFLMLFEDTFWYLPTLKVEDSSKYRQYLQFAFENCFTTVLILFYKETRGQEGCGFLLNTTYF